MPKRADINSVLVIGAGPIIIGQACEFDYSGTQACRALREEGIRVVLLNSNPATIMTDADLADATYIEPIDRQTAAEIIEKEKVDAVLPTMGGQTALNCAMQLSRDGVLGRGRAVDGRALAIGSSAESIVKAEDREAFRQAMQRIGLKTAPSVIVGDLKSAVAALDEIGFPIIVRPSFTLGGSGGGVAYNHSEFNELIARGLSESPTNSVLMERSLLGWKEYEMEVVRDKNDNCIIVCGIENVDPMGVHTGDSITVAPIQTLTDKEYQIMRDASIAVLREIGVDTGGANVQFAVNPQNGDMVIIEMNPRVSRSSALASKATGFPIAKVATKLAIGYTLDEISNDITQGRTPASFEPSIDYVVTKIPRFDFAKFPGVEDRLTTQMRSVGEVMAIGRTFAESLQKALRSLEIGVYGLQSRLGKIDKADTTRQKEQCDARLSRPHSTRLLDIGDAYRLGYETETVAELTGIDPWFLNEIAGIIQTEDNIRRCINGDEKVFATLDAKTMRQWKQWGFCDKQIADIAAVREDAVRDYRHTHNIHPAYKRIDTCAGEFFTETSYLYSAYEPFCELNPSARKKIMILGSGPNRIGQGVEFDYCCVHGVMALKAAGYETIMVNCNPETVSTDYDTADRLFFEPLTVEDVREIIRREKPVGVIVQFGGQTPLSIAAPLAAAGAPIIGTTVDAIHATESREQFKALLDKCGLRQPKNAIVNSAGDDTAATAQKILASAAAIGYPLVVRPSYVLGGRAMRIVYSPDMLAEYLKENTIGQHNDVLLDSFLDDAIEVDVDAIRDVSGQVWIAGVMEHIERAGIHSGDSACCLPPHSLAAETVQALKTQAVDLANAVGVVGLMNVQFAIQNKNIYVLEVNPRASRTVPFVSKATGVAVAKIAAQVMAGVTLQQQGVVETPMPSAVAIKEAVFPFDKFPTVDVRLGPEMKSTGETMGIAENFAHAFYSAQAAILTMPQSGKVFFSVRDDDKPAALECARIFVRIGFELAATQGTAKFFEQHGLQTEKLHKLGQARPNIVDKITSREAVFVANTRNDSAGSYEDSYHIRRAVLAGKVIYSTTMAGTAAVAQALQSVSRYGRAPVRPLQEWYAAHRTTPGK